MESLNLAETTAPRTAVGMRVRKPSSLMLRWAILALSCLSMTGVYYSFDVPAALHQQLEDYMASSGNYAVKFNLLYTVYSIPNVILPFFGGNIVDRLGGPLSIVIFNCFTFLGQLLVALGADSKNWALMIIGRVVYGFGGESVCVATSTIISIWFEGKELAFAFGINMAVSRMGSVFNNLISPAVANSTSPPVAFWVGVAMNASALLSGIGVGYLDRRGNRKCDDINQATALLTASLLEDDRNNSVPFHENGAAEMVTRTGQTQKIGDNETTETDDTVVRLSDVKRFGIMFWLLSASCVVVYGCVLPFNNVASGILLQRNYFKSYSPESQCTLEFPNQCTYGTLQPMGINPSFDSNGNACPINTNYSPILPTTLNISKQNTTDTSSSSWHEDSYVFDSITRADVDCGDPFWSNSCTKDYCAAQSKATEKAGRVMSIPYLISATLSPFLGYVVDKVGYRTVIASMASVMLILVHISLAVSRASPVVPLIGQGIAYSLYAAVIWPSVPLTVDAKYTGMAFGAITSVQNIGLALFPLIIAGVFNISHQQYIPNVEYFFVACAICGTLIGIALNILDRWSGGKLNNVHVKDDTSNEKHDSDYVALEAHDGNAL